MLYGYHEIFTLNYRFQNAFLDTFRQIASQGTKDLTNVSFCSVNSL